MKQCINCGAEMRDGANFCPVCGKAYVQPEQAKQNDQGGNQGYENQMQGYQNYGYQGYGNQMQGYQGYGDQMQGYQNFGYQGYENQMQGNQGYGDQMQGYQSYGNQGYGNQMQGNPNYIINQTADDSGEKKSKKEKPKKSKKKWVVAGICLVVVLAVAAVLICIFGRTLLMRHKIEEKAEQYVKHVEDLNVEKVVGDTIPKKLVKDIMRDVLLEDDEDSEEVDEYLKDFDDVYDDFIEGMEDEIDVEEMEDDNFKIDLDNLEVEKIKKADVKSVIQDFYDDLGEDEIGGYTSEEICELVEEKAKDYDLDLNRFYCVDISVDVSVSCDDYDYDYDYDMSGLSINGLIDHFYAYEYDGEYYLIPGVEDVIMPSLKKYMAKSALSADVSNADTIRTVVMTVFSDETCYNDFYDSGLDGSYILVTDEGLQQLPESVREEFLSMMGELPKVQYTKTGYKDFVFTVDLYNWDVVVYVTDGTNYVKVSPDGDYYGSDYYPGE